MLTLLFYQYIIIAFNNSSDNDKICDQTVNLFIFFQLIQIFFFILNLFYIVIENNPNIIMITIISIIVITIITVELHLT